MIGLERIYAAGDVSSRSFKQGPFATQQADAVAEAIAAMAGAGVEPRTAAPQMRAVLWTGQGPRYLYSPEREKRATALRPQPAPPRTPP